MRVYQYHDSGLPGKSSCLLALGLLRPLQRLSRTRKAIPFPTKIQLGRGKEPVQQQIQLQREAGPPVPRFFSGQEIEVRHASHEPGIPGSKWTEELGVRPTLDEIGDAELQQTLAEGDLFQDR